MAGNDNSALQLNDLPPHGADKPGSPAFATDVLTSPGAAPLKTSFSNGRDNLPFVAVMQGDKVLAGNISDGTFSPEQATFSANGYQNYGQLGTPLGLRSAQADVQYPRVPLGSMSAFGLNEGYIVSTQFSATGPLTTAENGVTASPQTDIVLSPSDAGTANANSTNPAEALANAQYGNSNTNGDQSNNLTPIDSGNNGTSSGGGCDGGSSGGGGGCGGGGRGGLGGLGGGLGMLGGLARLGLGIGLLSTLFRGGGMGGGFGGLLGLGMLGGLMGGGGGLGMGGLGMGGMGMGGLGMGGLGMGGMGMGMSPFGMFGLLSMFRNRI